MISEVETPAEIQQLSNSKEFRFNRRGKIVRRFVGRNESSPINPEIKHKRISKVYIVKIDHGVGETTNKSWIEIPIGKR